MIDKACIVCGEFPALHKITLTRNDQLITHYLCSVHFQDIQDPKRFFSILDDMPVKEEHFYDISEFYID